jgi:hypothetical protein
VYNDLWWRYLPTSNLNLLTSKDNFFMFEERLVQTLMPVKPLSDTLIGLPGADKGWNFA